MIGYLEGKLVSLSPSFTYVDVGGVGYEVNSTLNTYQRISNANECRLFTHLQVREDAWVLYGFATDKERSAFRRLLSVSGVGAATARLMLSAITADELDTIIFNGDSKALEKIKGIGAKTAQRIILELKGKIELEPTPLASGAHNTAADDALIAMIGLGIGKPIAESALKKAISALDAEASVEELIKTALKNL